MSANRQPGSRTIRTVTPREIFKSMELGNPGYTDGLIDSAHAIDGKNTQYPDELRKGLIMARKTSDGKVTPCKRSKATDQGVSDTTITVGDSRAFAEGDTVSIVSKQDAFIVADLDAAAATGVAVYVHVDELDEGMIAHLESVTAGNADCYWNSASGAKIRVEDDDAAATGGVQLYFDEDAANPDERLLANLPTGKDAFLLSTDGRMIRIKYNATPATPGVAVYCDDDGVSAVLNRMYFVSPTNVSGVQITDDEVGLPKFSAWVTLASGLTISDINYDTNVVTIDAASHWGIGAHLIASGALAGLETARSILGEFVQLYDNKSRQVLDANTGALITSNAKIFSTKVLGDLAACLEATNYLDRIEFWGTAGRTY